MKSPLRLALLLVVPAIATAASPPSRLDVATGASERLPLFLPSDLKSWSTAESTVAPSTARTHDAGVALHWHVTVDYRSGEAKYPIGWPRLNRSFPAGPLRDWSVWDYLHGWVYISTNRDKLPAIPAGLGLHNPDRTGAFQRTLSELRAGAWVELTVPISAIPRSHDIRLIQFHIAESNYRDGDELDFYFSDLALVRYATPILLDFAPESAVLFADAARIPLRVHLAGLPAGARTEVACELQQGDRVVLRAALSAARGVQSATIALGAPPPPPGDYELRAHLPGQPQVVTARLRLVESPWK